MSELKLKKHHVVIIDLYYYLLLILSFIMSTICMLKGNTLDVSSNQIEILSVAVVGAISMSILGCSCFYIRKLYKLKLGNKIHIMAEDIDEIGEVLGAISYLISRPIYSAIFALVVILGMKSGLMGISSYDVQLAPSFIDLIMFICFFIGFGTGRVLNLVESKTEDILNNTFTDKKM